jgi:iron(III) transport system ATP-binding protein
MSPLPILQVEQVTKSFLGARSPTIETLSFNLAQGEIVALLGPSGCGKTTLLRMIAGFEPLQAGRLVLAGNEIATPGFAVPPEHRQVGMVFQDYALFPHLTVAQNIAFGLQHRRGAPTFRFFAPSANPAMAARVATVLQQVDLTGLEKRYPHQLSGGQQQRVALARALAPNPALILLDEPLSNLDMQVRLRLRQEIRTILKQAGASAIFVTHDQEEALGIADRVAVLHHGRLEQIDTPENLYNQPATRFVAEFVAQANLLAVQCHGNRWTTELGPLPDSSLQRWPTHADRPSNSPVVAMVRPEDVCLTLDPASPVVIGDRQFLGRDYRYSLRLPSGQRLSARAAMALPVGAAVSPSVVGDRIYLYTA